MNINCFNWPKFNKRKLVENKTYNCQLEEITLEQFNEVKAKNKKLTEKLEKQKKLTQDFQKLHTMDATYNRKNNLKQIFFIKEQQEKMEEQLQLIRNLKEEIETLTLEKKKQRITGKE